MLILTLGAGSCTSLPPQVPHQDEQVVGAPLPYEPPLTEVKPAPLLPAVATQVVLHGPRRTKKIALTFDACSTQGSSKFDANVIRALIDMNVPATLFLGGKWMEDHPDETIELAKHPQFELANHTYLHPHLPRVSDERIREELRRTQDIMHLLTGRVATLFRAPYGELDPRVERLVGEAGMVSIQYDLASGDPDPKITTKRLLNYVTDVAKSGSIIVMHMNGRGWHTAEALPRIVVRLRKKGYQLVTVSELLGRTPPALANESQGLSAR